MMPSSPINSRGGDEVRARDGTSCHQGNYVGPTLDVGVTGTHNTNSANSGQPVINNYNYNDNSGGAGMSNSSSVGGDIGVYARLVIPLGDDPNRVDCTKLYSLEIERLELELKRLKESGSASVTVD
jgi:hypothetical protein